MKKRILATMLIMMLSFSMVACDSKDYDDDERDEKKVVYEEKENLSDKEENVRVDEETLLKEYLEKELVLLYGTFNAKQTGFMREWDDEWFEPNGIMNHTIFDFDADKTDEMAVFYSKEAENGDGYIIYMDVYEVNKDKVALSDSFMVGAWRKYAYSDEENCIQLSANQNTEEFLNVSIVKDDDEYAIVFEYHCLASCFADGSLQDYWIMEYENEKIQYVGSFSQSGPGSSDFQFIAYEFDDGELEESEMYYSEWYEEPGIYNHLGRALAEFFDEYDIEVKDTIKNNEDSFSTGDFFDSVLSENNNITPVFTFTNKVISGNYDVGYEFQAEIYAPMQ